MAYEKEHHEKEGKLIPGPITFELTEEEIRAIKGGAKQIKPKHIVGGEGGFAIRNHTFGAEKVTLNLDPQRRADKVTPTSDSQQR
jgi:hypothetical protein